jgi:hypothetical protein
MPIGAALFVRFVPASIASLALAYRLARHLVGDRVSAILFLAMYVAGFRLLTVGSPILHSAELTPAFLALPHRANIASVATTGRPLPSGVQRQNAIEGLVGEEVAAAINGQKPIDRALADAERRVNSLLAQVD